MDVVWCSKLPILYEGTIACQTQILYFSRYFTYLCEQTLVCHINSEYVEQTHWTLPPAYIDQKTQRTENSKNEQTK